MLKSCTLVAFLQLLKGWDRLQVKVEEQRMEQTVHQTITAQSKNPGNIVRSVTSIRLGVDAERADEQDNEEGLADTLKEIVKRTVPSPVYAKYHEQHLQRFLSKLGAYTARQASSGLWLYPAILQAVRKPVRKEHCNCCWHHDCPCLTNLCSIEYTSSTALGCPIVWLGHQLKMYWVFLNPYISASVQKGSCTYNLSVL